MIIGGVNSIYKIDRLAPKRAVPIEMAASRSKKIDKNGDWVTTYHFDGSYDITFSGEVTEEIKENGVAYAKFLNIRPQDGFNEPSYSLDDENIARLSEKYDLENMSMGSEQEKAFLNELVSMNVISETDARLFNFNCGGSVETVSSQTSVMAFDGDAYDAIPLWNNVSDKSGNIVKRLMSIIAEQENISGYYERKCADKENAVLTDFAGLNASNDFLKGKENILSVLLSLTNSAE